LLLFGLLALTTPLIKAAESPCTITLPSGEYIDLRPLKKTSGDDWVAKDAKEDNKYIYRLNVCAPILYAGPASKPIAPNVSAHQTDIANDTKHWDLGLYNTDLTYADGIVTLRYVNGDVCRHTNDTRTAIIDFICDSSAGHGNPTFLYEDTDCNYIFEWTTKHACPTTKLSAGAITAIVFSCLFVAYIFVVMFYKRFILGKTGWEQIPHYNLCKNICSAFKCCADGKTVHYRKVAAGIGKEGLISLNDDEDDFDDDAVENNI